MELSELASADALDAKIDRPARTVAFGKPKTDLLVLEEWSSSLTKYVRDPRPGSLGRYPPDLFL